MPPFPFPLITERSLWLLITLPPFGPAGIVSFASSWLLLLLALASYRLKLSLSHFMWLCSVVAWALSGLTCCMSRQQGPLRLLFSRTTHPLRDGRAVPTSTPVRVFQGKDESRYLLMERGTFQGTNVKSLDKDPQQMSVQPRIELRYLGHTGPCSAPHISLLPFLSRPTVRCRE